MGTSARASRNSRQPRWPPVVLALVAVGTLAWAIVSHFFPTGAQKPGSPVTVIGDGNVTANTMNGVQIIQNSPMQAPAPGHAASKDR